ncbi:MAG: DUF1015 domain-containing protein [Candidatus Omnitrophica bacterium]|nr:DUF1015 domain-containing protein [Candidatus Omnitrophota bacterium]
MARIKPFKGIRYNPGIVGDISKVVAPPYDVISDKMQGEYYRLHKNNIIRLTLGKIKKGDTKSDNRYTRAKQYLDEWLKRDILMQDKEPSLYVYEQKYLFKNSLKSRFGFMGIMKIEDPHKSRVLPHEYTFAKPKRDRLSLVKAIEANPSPIFALFEDKGSAITGILESAAAGQPIVDFEEAGVNHRLWRLRETESIKRICNLIKGKQIFIADGHHRYEVSLNFRDYCQKKAKGAGNKERGYDYIMVYLSALSNEALTVLSTHRVIRSVKVLKFKNIYSKLKKYFSIERFKTKEEIFRRIEKAREGEFVFGMYYKNEGYLSLALRSNEVLNDVIKQDKQYEWKWLDVTILHQFIFDHLLKVKERVEKKDNVVYTRDSDYAVNLVDNENYQIAFFLNPPRIGQIKDVARSCDKMPRKTTYFYPKPLSGLVFYKMKDS